MVILAEVAATGSGPKEPASTAPAVQSIATDDQNLKGLMQRIADGLLPVRQEDGFTFVDVAPTSPQIAPPILPPEKRPATFTAVEESVEQPSDDDA